VEASRDHESHVLVLLRRCRCRIRRGNRELAPMIRLNEQLVTDLLGFVDKLHWRDGRTTARGSAAAVKDCQIAETFGDQAFSDEYGASVLARTMSVLFESEAFRERALPFRVSTLRYMRYAKGGSYGPHTDESINANGFRADLSFTIMLKPANVGGELMVHDAAGAWAAMVSMRSGEVRLYPSTTVHQVSEVVSGERIVIVGWVQSMVRDHDKRELLAELNRMAQNPAERQEVRIQAVRNELLRQWGG
jgi:PKHD-type hydroxylase